MAAETSNDETIPSSEEPENRKEWVIKIMKREKPDQQSKSKPRIPKVVGALHQIASYNQCFKPSVVSFGPYHHGKGNLKAMEPCKKDAAAWFISHAKKKPADNQVTEDEALSVYEKFIEEVEKVSSRDWTDWYEVKFESKEHFIRMMFLDGCFILYFIHVVVRGSFSDKEYILKSIRHHFNQASIVRDLFLLENQIPFPILESLISLLPDPKMTVKPSIIKFIFMVFLPSYVMDYSWNISRIGCFRVMIWISELFSRPVRNANFIEMSKSLFEVPGKKPPHLLHVLREVLIGVRKQRDSPDSPGGSAGYWNYCFRPIRQLKAAGIQVRRSGGMTLKDLKFEWGFLNSHLEIPQIIVDGSTKTRLLNLAAYEMCPDGPEDLTVTSYICLLDSLIDHAEDVKELQSEKILLNNLGSGEVVCNLFKKLAANLSPDSNVYAHVINGIEKHYNRPLNYGRTRIGRWIHQFKCTYFSSPWTLISLIAAVSVIALTLLQTIYTMWAFYKTY